MKALLLITTLVMLVLPLVHGGAGLNSEEASRLPFDTKVYHYWQTCACYMLVTDDGTNDGCEIFYDGSSTWNNGKCD